MKTPSVGQRVRVAMPDMTWVGGVVRQVRPPAPSPPGVRPVVVVTLDEERGTVNVVVHPVGLQVEDT